VGDFTLLVTSPDWEWDEETDFNLEIFFPGKIAD
jgi:hypothetical protein